MLGRSATLAVVLGAMASNAQTVYEALAANAEALDLQRLLDVVVSQTDGVDNYPAIISTLNDTAATLTVFAPTTTEFEAFETALGIDCTAAAAVSACTDVLLYHVTAAGAVESGDLALGNNRFPTLLDSTNGNGGTATGLLVNAKRDGASVMVGSGLSDATVTTANTVVDNGVIHIVDDVLRVPKLVSETAGDTGLHQTLIDLLVARPDTLNAVDTTAGITVFAPVDDGFATFLGQFANGTLSDASVTSTLNYHVVPGAAFSDELVQDQELTTLNGEKLTVDLNGGVFLVDAFGKRSEVAVADVITDNGVVHAVSDVLAESASFSIAEVAQQIDAVSSLASVVTDSKYSAIAEALSNRESTLTVFAPVNAAFEELAEAGVDCLAEGADCSAVLTYHVLTEEVRAADLVDNTTVTTLQGEDLRVILNDTGAFLVDAMDQTVEIVLTDIEAAGGVIHAVDKVLMPADADSSAFTAGASMATVALAALFATLL